MNTRASLAALAGLALSFPGATPAQPVLEQPVGLVIAARDGKVVRAGNELPIAARDGDVLYAGDGLRSGTAPITFLFCPEKSSQNLEPNGSAILQSDALRITGRLSEKRTADFCALPRMERTPPASQQHYGMSLTRALSTAPASPVDFEKVPEPRRSELRARLAETDRAIERNPKDAVARVARAALYEEYRLTGLAFDEYQAIAALWPDAAWVGSRIFVHGKELGRTAPSLTSLRDGKVYALLVGISKYQRLPQKNWLRYADRDALVFADYLRSPRGGGLPESDIVLLTDEKATTAAVRNAFETFIKTRAGKNDTVLIFIAAHGILETTGKRGAYIVTYDSDPEDLASTALPMADLQSLVQEDLPRVGHVLVYVDVCRAGNIGSRRGSNNLNRVVEQLAEAEGDLLLFTASGPKEISLEGPQFGAGHGAFSYFLLDAMNGAADFNKDGRINVGEIIEYVRDRVIQATVQKQHPRDAGNMDRAVVVTETNRPGILLGGFSGAAGPTGVRGRAGPVPDEVRAEEELAQRGLDDAITGGRIMPDSPGGAFAALGLIERQMVPEGYLLAQNKLRVALEDQGQQVLLRYLAGEQTPQTRDDFLRGAAYYEAARSLTPESLLLQARAAFCSGRALLFEKSYERAIEQLERAVSFDPGAAYAYNALGIAYLEQADYPNAILAFRDAIHKAPDWAYARHNLALAYTQTGDYTTAIRTYQQAIETAPQYAYLPYNLGLLFQRLNRKKEAEASYRKAIALAPDAAEPYNVLGTLYAAYGRTRAAETSYRGALDRDPKLLPARHNLAVLLAAQSDRVPEAQSVWRQNLADAPGYLPSRLSLARSLAANGGDGEAAREYEDIVRQRPDYVAARLALAEVQVRMQRPVEAVSQLKAALSIQPGNPTIHERIGDIEVNRGQMSEAQESYGLALLHSGDSSARKRILAKMKTGLARR